MIIVTGGAGFIGSNLIAHLNRQNHRDIIVVDDLTQGKKFENLLGLEIADYQDKEVFKQAMKHKASWLSDVTAVFHQGACSTTTEWNGQYMMEENFETSKQVFALCQDQHIPMVYASSAAVYGGGTVFQEQPACESPLNVYGYSKVLFDHWLRQRFDKLTAPVMGLRYFNVYGPRESHKGSMASVAYHFYHQLRQNGIIKLFEGTDGYGHGEQRRDFVFIDDVVAVNTWLWQNPTSGIYNVGTGRSQTFNDVAQAVRAWFDRGEISYIPFPAHLKGAYQSFTEANISALRRAGYTQSFKTVEEGVACYCDWLSGHTSLFQS